MKSTSRYQGQRCPPEVIRTAVWLYHRFSLSFRDVEDLLAQRGVIVSYESIRRWCLKFGSMYQRTLKRREPKGPDRWFADEMFVKINGEHVYLWRAVDHDGDVLDIMVLSGSEHGTRCYANNRAENSLQATRRRERQVQRFKSAEQAESFLSAHA